MIHYIATPFLFVSADAMQPMLFKNKFNVQEKDSGSKNSNILLANMLT